MKSSNIDFLKCMIAANNCNLTRDEWRVFIMWFEDDAITFSAGGTVLKRRLPDMHITHINRALRSLASKKLLVCTKLVHNVSGGKGRPFYEFNWDLLKAKDQTGSIDTSAKDQSGSIDTSAKDQSGSIDTSAKDQSGSIADEEMLDEAEQKTSPVQQETKIDVAIDQNPIAIDQNPIAIDQNPIAIDQNRHIIGPSQVYVPSNNQLNNQLINNQLNNQLNIPTNNVPIERFLTSKELCDLDMKIELEWFEEDSKYLKSEWHRINNNLNPNVSFQFKDYGYSEKEGKTIIEYWKTKLLA